ncbi:MAG: ATP-dependent zinc metalloprotease FtsH [Chlamydiota bacterium]
MANDKKNVPDIKKGMPGGFLFFLVMMIILFFAIQSLTGDKTRSEKIAFSYQLEHLVNLNLIDPSSSFKIAQNDNLVTFMGKFKEELPQEGKDKIAYLELLNKNHDLIGEKNRLVEDQVRLQKNVRDSANWFLQISGLEIPKSGFVVIGSVYDTFDATRSVLLLPVSVDSVNLAALEQEFASGTSGDFDKKLFTLVQYFRSSKLGIGTEWMKQQLKEMEKNFETRSDKNLLHKETLVGLRNIVNQLLIEKDSICLRDLRSVRSYIESIDQNAGIVQELEKNEALLDKVRQNVASVVWFFHDKELSTLALEKQDPEDFRYWFTQAKQEWENFSQSKGLTFKAPDQPRTIVLERAFKSEEPTPNYFNYIFTLLPVLLVVFVLYFIFSKQMKGVGSSAMNFGKSPAKLLAKDANKVTFKDVAGVEEAKEELKEIVDFLKDPQKFTTLGARIPKGVLLVGPPGTGKTLVAKAVAGEADCPFFSISGSDFVEMFVGVGASRIRDLFEQARKQAPCIIFIDEIDAVGRHRGAGIGGGHDEREQTLNQLLVEMDGFDTKEGVILMAATNRPDILDRALLRPGRFDRRVVLDLPDIKGRYEILKVHARRIKIDPSVELMDIAKKTPGSSGADLENMLNEAALLAAGRGRSAVTTSEVLEACDKVRFGKERRSLEMDAEEKRTTAYHEAGHAIVGLKLSHIDPIEKVTIIPRGFSLGSTHVMPKKNRLSYWRKEMVDQIAFCMGGRAAEEFFIKDISSGAKQDISQATRVARAMVCEWGMSDELGTVAYDEQSESGQYAGMPGYHNKTYSDETARKIDKQVLQLVNEGHAKALEIVEQFKDKVDLMAEMLLEFETLDSRDIKDIMEGSWSTEEKKKRLDDADKLQKMVPPPIPTETKKKVSKEVPQT